MDQNQDKRRGYSHRPRRGSERRGPERRPAPQPGPQDRQGRDQVDVEQIMRDIRGRIAQRQGIDLSNQQIQDLAARRLESVLDPRAIKPSLLDGLRRGAAAPTGPVDKIPNEPTFSFEDTTIYDSHRGALRFARRLFNPLLKLLFNPNPLIQALHLQAKLNVETAERNAERDRRQTEWNALHFEIVQRMVTEVSRVSLELQALTMRVDALAARVDFNDRRVGLIEGSAQRARPQGRAQEPVLSSPPTAALVTTGPNPHGDAPAAGLPPAGALPDAQAPDVARRRRRRRRGRRGGPGPGEFQPVHPHQPQSTVPELDDQGVDQEVDVDSGATLDRGVSSGEPGPATATAEATARPEGQPPDVQPPPVPAPAAALPIAPPPPDDGRHDG